MTSRTVTRHPSGATEADPVAHERPLELVVQGEPLAVLLRTPTGFADDRALAAGFLLSEGVIASAEDLVSLEPCRDPRSEGNRLHIGLAPGVVVPAAARRAFASTSACGLCGKSSIAALAQRFPPRRPPAPLEADVVLSLTAQVQVRQAAFSASGSVHAAALFDGRDLIALNEDVGRHNAVDKVLGHLLLTDRPVAGLTLWVSGRVSFEIAQKALIANLGALVAVGGPTDLAVDLANEHGLILIGFCRPPRFNLYAGSLA